MRIPAAAGTERPDLGRQRPDLNPADGRAERRFALTFRLRCVTALPPMSSGGCGLYSPGGWAGRRSCSQQCGLPGGTRDIRGDDVSGMPVQAAAGTLCRIVVLGVRMPGSFLNIAQRDPGIKAAVMNACRSVSGVTALVIPARRVTWRTIRPAP